MNKQSEIQVSVIILTYNTSVESIISTITSVLKQKKCIFEILISDDGSSYFPKKEIELFFSINNFGNYIILEREKNVGTVRNLEFALEKAHAKYVKDIGQGDILYNQYTLYDFYNYAEEKNADVVIGDAVPFRLEDDKINVLNSPVLPYDIKCYKKGKKEVKKFYLLYGDYASGVAFFFNRRVMIEYLRKLETKVKLAEDLVLRLMVYEEKNIFFVEKNVMFYEIGVGVSWKDNGLSQMNKDVLGVTDLLMEIIKDKDIHLRNVLLKRNELMLNNSVMSKAKYYFSDLSLILFKIKKKLFPRKIEDVHEEFLYDCLDSSVAMKEVYNIK